MVKGKIISIGGNVDTYPDEPIFKRFYEEASPDDGPPLIGIIPSASNEPISSGKKYSDLFDRMGADTCIIHPENRDQADEEMILSKLEDPDAFFFTGGNQLRITGLFSGTEAFEKLEQRFTEEKILIGGTSAGAACMTRTMISKGESNDSLLSGEVELSQGLGFIEDAVIDTHFTARGRFPRLVHVVTENPGLLGVGIGEDTAAIWNFVEEKFSVLGSRNLIVVDGSDISATNMAEIAYGEPIYAENVKVHILANGCEYNYRTRKPFFPKGIHPAHDKLNKKEVNQD